MSGICNSRHPQRFSSWHYAKLRLDLRPFSLYSRPRPPAFPGAQNARVWVNRYLIQGLGLLESQSLQRQGQCDQCPAPLSGPRLSPRQGQSRCRARRALGGSRLSVQSLPAWGSSSLRHGSAILSLSPFMVPEGKQADAAGLALGRYLNEIAENSRKTQPSGWGWQPWTPPSTWHGLLNSQLWGCLHGAAGSTPQPDGELLLHDPAQWAHKEAVGGHSAWLGPQWSRD